MRPAMKILMAAAFVASACADKVPTDSNACPCATGYVCCQSGVCAADEASCGAATAALSLAAQGKWVGYIENYTGLPSGSDRVELSLDVGADGQLQGHLTLGTEAPPPPATEAERAWPRDPRYPFAPLQPWLEGPPIEGFVYNATAVKWQARRLRFNASYGEPWAPWCALQTSYPVPNATDPRFAYICLPPTHPGTGGTADGRCLARDAYGVVLYEYDCGVDFLCMPGGIGGACFCSATGCAPLGDSVKFSFDLDIQGDDAEGSIGWTDGDLVGSGRSSNVRLIRAAR